MLERDPLFSPRMTFKGNRATPELSWAEQAGLELTDLTDLTKREEVLRSTLAERIPVYGVYVRASNRAYTSFLNHVRANAFRDLAKSMGIWNGRQITDMPKAKELADFVNTTTGRGKLEVTIPGLGKTYNFEKSTEHLADIFFSPRLQTSRIKMLNPATYLHAPKDLRMQWIKALMTAVGSWWTITSLLELMGAKVSKDPNSSDFGKARIGNSRIDPGGGFQQYMVINHRILPQILGHTLAPTEFSQMLKPSHTGVTPVDLATGFFGHPGGGITSPISGQFHQYGQGYRPETAMSDFTRFTANKLHPIPRLAYDVLARDERHPVYVADRVMQLFLPMYASDIYEVYQDNPMLLAPMLVGSSIGMGTQTFEGGPGKPSITPMLGMDKYDMKLR
jgi:hypothetical protein